MKRGMGIALAALAFAGWGCVEIEQEIHVNHDGSGKIVEKIALSPRGARMAEAAGREGGAAGSALFSEEAFQERLKSMGEVTLQSRQETKLSDGRRQLQCVYTFKDISKIRLWVVPTLSYKRKITKETRGLDGGIGFNFRPRYESWGRVWKETVDVHGAWPREYGQPVMSPAERQKFVRVLPVFLDMVQDLKLSIVLVAPIEEFEEPQDMLSGLQATKNRVTLFKVDGQGLSQAGPAMLQLISDEAVDPGTLQGAPGVIAPNGGMVRFMKSEPILEKKSDRPNDSRDRNASVPASAPAPEEGPACVAAGAPGAGDPRGLLLLLARQAAGGREGP